MKTFLKYLAVFLVGVLVTQIPDLICLYTDHVEDKYVRATCAGKSPEACDFFEYFPKFEADHATLNKVRTYFLMGEGPVYFVLSGRCSNGLFHNSNAAPKLSGKITLRNYFFSRCSHAMNAASDIIFRDADKEQDPSFDDVTAGDRSK